MMRTRLHLKPGQKGTKPLIAQYGDRLVCVRYRYDAQGKKRFKTVELIDSKTPWRNYQMTWPEIMGLITGAVTLSGALVGVNRYISQIKFNVRVERLEAEKE